MGAISPGMVDFFLEIALPVCNIFFILAKIRLPLSNSFPLDHKEVTEPASRDISGGREASLSQER